MRAVFILLLPLLTACAGINPKAVSGPNGRPAYQMQCSGLGRTLEACHAKAEALCPAGYTVFAKRTETVVVHLMDGGKLAVPERSIEIECD